MGIYFRGRRHNFFISWISLENEFRGQTTQEVIVMIERVRRISFLTSPRFGRRSLALHWGWDFPSYKIELRNLVTQNTSHFELLTHKFFIEILFSRNSSFWIIQLNFELLTPRSNFCFSTFELLTRSEK